MEAEDIDYQQNLEQVVDYIRNDNNKIETMLKDANIAEFNRLERERRISKEKGRGRKRK